MLLGLSGLLRSRTDAKRIRWVVSFSRGYFFKSSTMLLTLLRTEESCRGYELKHANLVCQLKLSSYSEPNKTHSLKLFEITEIYKKSYKDFFAT